MKNSKTGSFSPREILEKVERNNDDFCEDGLTVEEALLDLRKLVEGKKYPVVRNYVARKAEWISGYNQAIQNIVEDFI